MKKEKYQTDFFGQVLIVGDYVLGSSQGGFQSGHMTPELFRIIKFTPKRVKVLKVGFVGYDGMRTAADLVKIDPKLITLKKLTES